VVEEALMHIVYFISQNTEYLEMVRLSIDTVRHCAPDAEIHLFTDLPAGIPGINTYQDMEGYKVPLMIKNTEVWRDFCASQQGDVIFLDPDVLMARKPDLEALQDIAVTWRDGLGDISRRMPYNTGVVMAKCGQRSAQFFNLMVQRIEAMPEEHQKWYGNQLALAELLGEPNHVLRDMWKHQRDEGWSLPYAAHDAIFNQLPCDMYNWTPEGDEPWTGEYFVHLKGNRKFRMTDVRNQIVGRPA